MAGFADFPGPKKSRQSASPNAYELEIRFERYFRDHWPSIRHSVLA